MVNTGLGILGLLNHSIFRSEIFFIAKIMTGSLFIKLLTFSWLCEDLNCFWKYDLSCIVSY